MSLTYPIDPSLPSNPSPLFSDTSAARGDHLRGNNAEIWGNFNSLQSSKIEAISASVAEDIALFDGITGNLLKDSGVKISTDGTMNSDSSTKIPTESAIRTFKNLNIPFSTALDKTILDTEKYNEYILTGAGASKTFTLPTLADNQNKIYTLYNNDSTYMLTVDGEGSEIIDGMLTIQLPKKRNYITVIGTATEWRILGERITSQLRLSGIAGRGSTDTAILRFTNVLENVGNMFTQNHVSGYSGNAKGLELVCSRSGWYYGSLDAEVATGMSGATLNSAALTTAISSITDDTIISQHYASSTYFVGSHIYFLRYFKAGDVVRFQDDKQGIGADWIPRMIFTYVGK